MKKEGLAARLRLAACRVGASRVQYGNQIGNEAARRYAGIIDIDYLLMKIVLTYLLTYLRPPSSTRHTHTRHDPLTAHTQRILPYY